MKGRNFIQVALIALAVLLMCTGTSSAGTMHVYSCHTPSGASAGIAGWSSGGVGTGAFVSNSCATGPHGSLYAQAIGGSEPTPVHWRAFWTFAAVRDTTITGFFASMCPKIAGGYVVVNWRGPSGSGNSDEFRLWPQALLDSTMSCHGLSPYWADTRNHIQRSGFEVGQIWFVASCLFCSGWTNQGQFELSSFRADIRDDHAPVVTAVRGPLAANLSHTGVESVEFDVADVGVGVYRAVIEARLLGKGDWVTMSIVPIGQGRESCTETHVTLHPYEFDSPQPCPLSVAGARVDFNTDLLTAGEHDLRVLVEDATGNRTQVITPRKFFATGPTGAAAPALTAAGRTIVLRLAGAGRQTVSPGAFQVKGKITEVDGRPLLS